MKYISVMANEPPAGWHVYLSASVERGSNTTDSGKYMYATGLTLCGRDGNGESANPLEQSKFPSLTDWTEKEIRHSPNAIRKLCDDCGAVILAGLHADDEYLEALSRGDQLWVDAILEAETDIDVDGRGPNDGVSAP